MHKQHGGSLLYVLSLLVQGTPTHMSPELIISGHVSRASDVYAFGILLYEVITGQRAYAGIPIPLLPHEVARQGLRPKWPADLPPHYKQWMPLAEACWTSKPADRCALRSHASQLTLPRTADIIQ